MGMDQQLTQAALGGQRHLRLTSVPAAASPALVNKTLTDAGQLTVAGDYYCRIEIGGLSSVNVHLTATIAAGTAASDIVSCYLIPSGTSDATAFAAPYAYQGFTGDGSLTTTTRQTASLSPTVGEQFAIVKITLATSPQVTFTQAEFNGPR